MPAQPPAQKSMTPEMLLSSIENQAEKSSFDIAAGLSSKFVERLIAAGHLKDMKVITERFFEGINLIQPGLKKSQLALSMKDLEQYLKPAEVKH